jgi:ribonuclease HI
MEDPNALNIYTDGSSFQGPRQGGVGVRFVFPDIGDNYGYTKDMDYPGYKGGNIAQMEIKACILALTTANSLPDTQKIKRIIIHSDSMYVVNNYKKAVFSWPKNKWRLSGGGAVLNVQLWKDLTKAIKKISIPVDIQWVKGHSNNIHNRKVDKLAKKSAKGFKFENTSSINLRRKTTKTSTEIGSVKMLGQKITIRIVTSEYLSNHSEYRYRYEVLSKRSDYFRKIDFVNYNIPLKVGHKFYVKLNKQQTNPKIIKVYREV